MFYASNKMCVTTLEEGLNLQPGTSFPAITLLIVIYIFYVAPFLKLYILIGVCAKCNLEINMGIFLSPLYIIKLFIQETYCEIFVI